MLVLRELVVHEPEAEPLEVAGQDAQRGGDAGGRGGGAQVPGDGGRHLRDDRGGVAVRRGGHPDVDVQIPQAHAQGAQLRGRRPATTAAVRGRPAEHRPAGGGDRGAHGASRRTWRR
ncbi:hypothetical protein AB0L40_11350 [Patulibacter sp. NPDC049589]|uniref:hypothetical protein n=1 Tax=Patulibacter sp. NPDC049589 TaxID=3154731 RepID=UPI003419D341